MKSNVRFLIRGFAFLIVFCIAFSGLQGIFGLDYRLGYENLRDGYLREKKDSLDAVYIGASNVYAFWQSLFGWNERGIAVWSYSIGSMPVAAMKYLMIEAHKTQPNAVFIFNLNMFKTKSAYGSMRDIHRAADYLPFSINKIQLINCLCEGTGYTGLDRLEFFFPIIRFHSRWDSLGSWIFGVRGRDYKSSLHTPLFFETIKDVSSSFELTDQQNPLPEDMESCINELLDYCDDHKIRALFVKVPQAVAAQVQGKMNTLEDLVIARGYPCLDLLEHMDDAGIQFQTDFYNANHTNIHGSLKYCRYLADYLVEQYGFTDKRGTRGWESWDEAAAFYLDEARSYTLPFELVSGPRDYSLPIPRLAKPKTEDRTIVLSWEPSEGADGYEIFRYCSAEDSEWQSVAVVESETKFTDPDLQGQTNYSYQVVPFKMTDSGRAYGNFDVTGVSAKTGGQE